MRPSDQEADAYIERKLDQLPRWLGSPIRKLLRDPRLWLRMTIGVLLIFGGMLWFLPVLGLWMLPLGFFLVAGEFPPMRRWCVAVAMRMEQRFCRRDVPPR